MGRRRSRAGRRLNLKNIAKLAIELVLFAALVIWPNRQEILHQLEQAFTEPEPWNWDHSGEMPYDAAAPESLQEAAKASGQDCSQLVKWGVPAYDGTASFAEVNNGFPFFTEEELSATEAYESYSPLDPLGRCGKAEAVLGKELMPEEKRGDISSVHPTGWQEMKESAPELQRARCHLIAFMLAGENANECNLITGSHDYFNMSMLPYEIEAYDYVSGTGGLARYRVTPVFDGEDILARGVLMEAQSIGDGGEALRYCVFVYNAAPGYDTDYRAGIWTQSGQ